MGGLGNNSKLVYVELGRGGFPPTFFLINKITNVSYIIKQTTLKIYDRICRMSE